MRKSLNRIAAGAMSLAMAGSFLLNVTPVHAASASVISDTLTREAVSVTAAHTLVFSVGGAGGWDNTETMVITYTGFSGIAGPVTVAGTGPSTATGAVTGGDTLTITCTTVAGCSGHVWTVTGMSMSNPATPGTYTATIGPTGTSGLTGSFSIPIADSDQVTINASVAVSVTFDIDTEVNGDTLPSNNVEVNAPYVVNLGTVSLTDTRVSGTTDGVNYIMLDVDSNAQGGTVVTVHNQNDVLGLRSVSVPGDDIATSNGLVTDGTERYGICSVTSSATNGALTATAGSFSSGCAADTEGNTVLGLTTAPQEIYNTATDPVTGGRAMIAVQASIDTTTPAHNDYQDVLTFIATSTF